MPQKQHDHTTDYAFLFEQGEEKALCFFYHALYPALVHFSFQMTGNRMLAEELVSEAFVKTWRMHFKLNSSAGIKAYLYKVVHRDSLDAICSEQKRIRNLQQLPPPAENQTPFDLALRSEVYRLVHTAIKGLTPANKKVVTMHFLEGKTTGQISRELSLHPSTIKTQKKQGLEALRKVLVNIAGYCLYYFQVFFNFF